MTTQRASDDEREREIARSQGNRHVLDAVPGLVRLAGSAGWRTAESTARFSLRASRRLLGAVARRESAADLLSDMGGSLREQARIVLGVVDIEQSARGPLGDPGAGPGVGSANGTRDGSTEPYPSLSDRGAELLMRSADVTYEVAEHPAYERILAEMAPDEARVLRLLATQGSQPAVDVRTWRPFDVGSQMMAPGLSMIAQEAGCRYPDRLPAYLNNLFRLGTIWFSREPLPDHRSYQLLEAQPDVVDAIRRAGRAKTVRRSILLTPFGLDFCETCIPLETPIDTGEFPAVDTGAAKQEQEPPAPERH